MSYVKNFLLHEDGEETEGPGIEDEIQSILRPLYDPHPTNRDITYQLIELVKSDDMGADEIAERLDILVKEILAIQRKVRKELPVEFRSSSWRWK